MLVKAVFWRSSAHRRASLLGIEPENDNASWPACRITWLAPARFRVCLFLTGHFCFFRRRLDRCLSFPPAPDRPGWGGRRLVNARDNISERPLQFGMAATERGDVALELIDTP